MTFMEACKKMRCRKIVESKSLDRIRKWDKLSKHCQTNQFLMKEYRYKDTPIEDYWWSTESIDMLDIETDDWEVVDE